MRDDDIPEQELRVRPTVGLGHSGIVTLAVGGEGAVLVGGGAGGGDVGVHGVTRARDVEGEGRQAATVEVAAAVLLGQLADADRGYIHAFVAISLQHPEQQLLLPPHRRNHQQALRPARDGRWPDYCCCTLVVSGVIVACRCRC